MKAPRTPPWQRRHLPRAAVCGAFGLGRPIQARRTGGAYLNRVWRLDTERGSFAVKVLNQRFEDPIRRAEYRAGLDLERAMLGTGLRLPEPVEGQGGDWLMDLPCGTTRVHHWMEGRPVRDRQLDPRQAWQVGEVVAAAHAVGPPRQASPKEILRCWTPEHWEEPARILTELKPLPAMIEQVSEVVVGGRALIRAPVLCHCDVTSKNLVELTDGTVVLLDWDAAQPMEPALELAAAAVNLAGYIRAQPRADVLRAFLAGYRMAGGRFTGGDHRVFAALLDGMLGWIWLNYRRAVAGRTSLERKDGRLACARAVDRMPHIVGSLPDWADELRRWSREPELSPHGPADPSPQQASASRPVAVTVDGPRPSPGTNEASSAERRSPRRWRA